GWGSSVAWGDYDNDGDLDILFTGSGIAKIFRNDGGNAFAEVPLQAGGRSRGSVACGDYDNDGDLDVLLSGSSALGAESVTEVYRHDGNDTFTSIGAALPSVWFSSAAWGDYDNDGDLDILLAGDTGNDAGIGKIYCSHIEPSNTAPSPPSGLSATV